MPPASWRELSAFYTSAGFSDERIACTSPRTSPAAARPGPDEDERIEIVPWPLDRLDAAIAECEDAKSLIALLWLARASARAEASAGCPRDRCQRCRRRSQAAELTRPANTVAMAIADVPTAQRRLTELTLEFWRRSSWSAVCRATRWRPTAPTCSSSALPRAARDARPAGR